jgi:hypothetical protein
MHLGMERPKPRLIRSPEDAEERAAEWLCCFGFTDAVTTTPGADGGVDIESVDIVAQVKAEMKSIGRPVIQQIRGEAAVRNVPSAVFSLRGFSAEAIAWASSGNAYWLALGQDGHYSNIEHPDIGPQKYPVRPAGFVDGVLYGDSFDVRRQAGSVWRLEADNSWTHLADDPELLGLVNEFYIANDRAFINEVGDTMSDGGRLPSSTVWTSEDLSSWTKTEGLTSGTRISATDFGWINETGFVSSNGIQWEDIGSPGTSDWYTVSYVNGLFFYIGGDGLNDPTSVWVGRPTDNP